ncbi:BnaC09g31410D [Brassica napus]|uniref:BnaC09g31410D protein n=1 Tax=Brassica napus TaxID=3708 RepID=A0A078FZY0_BRANA|nr:BnaC09g31410D [Brassica napus]
MGRPKKTRGMKKQMRLDEAEEVILLEQSESSKTTAKTAPFSRATPA